MSEAYEVVVKEKVLQQDMYYKDNLILRYTIKYPKFLSETFETVTNKINAFYRTKAMMYVRSNVMNLYQMAMVEYEYSVKNNFPIRQFEAFTDFEVTYNQNCMISLYFDQYEYAGGAHGLTVRSSDTWNLIKSKRADLSEFFPLRSNYRESIINSIIQQIDHERTQDEFLYFENYAELVREHFKANSFYLTQEGVVIYYQHYDIAPYASGIRTFTIPYGPGGAIEPRC